MVPIETRIGFIIDIFPILRRILGESKEILPFDMIQAKQLKIKSLRNNVNPYLDEVYYIERTVIRDSYKFRAAIYKKYKFRCYMP